MRIGDACRWSSSRFIHRGDVEGAERFGFEGSLSTAFAGGVLGCIEHNGPSLSMFLLLLTVVS